jgi:hypothetical protein
MPDVFGLDISNYQWPLTQQQVNDWRTIGGVEHCIVRASLESWNHRDITRRQCAMLQEAGIGISAYIWQYPDDAISTPPNVVRQSLELMQDYAPVYYWLDVEDVEHSRGPAANIQSVRRYMNELDAAGVRSGIYTGLWYWNDHRVGMAATDAFADRDLWVAEYDGDPDRQRWTRFGGWHTALVKQYQGSRFGRILGMPCDLNTFAPEAVQEGEDPVRIAELEQRVAELESTEGALRHDVIYKARLELDGALATSGVERGQKVAVARDLLASEERGD